MHITKTSLYKKQKRRVPKRLQLTAIMIAVLAPYQVLTNPIHHSEPYEQKFLLTAYYSPIPGQCCYVLGGLKADQVMNGKGVYAKDGTKVYPGMVAAPKSYPFDTKIRLPGLGTFAVHDRGGAINELGSIHRLDIWVGHGEEGLARALAFGDMMVTGTVYPNATKQPAVSFTLDTLPSPINELKTYFVEKDSFLNVRPKQGERGLSVALLQDHLNAIGYFGRNPTGFFGPETVDAYGSFVSDFGVRAPKTELTKESAAYLLGARKRVGARQPFTAHVAPEASAASITEAQRILRFLGFYKGKTNGQYDDNLFASILKFQKEYGLVGSAEDTGAGRIGPQTSDALRAAWNRRIVTQHADRYLDLHAVDEHIKKKGRHIAQFLGEGHSGNQVRLLQNALSALGFFPEQKVNGVYGPLTHASVLRYQLDRDIIRSASHVAAGYVGPATLRSLRNDQRNILYTQVRTNGWKSL